MCAQRSRCSRSNTRPSRRHKNLWRIVIFFAYIKNKFFLDLLKKFLQIYIFNWNFFLFFSCYEHWKNEILRRIYGSVFLCTYFVIPVVIITFCYTSISLHMSKVKNCISALKNNCETIEIKLKILCFLIQKSVFSFFSGLPFEMSESIIQCSNFIVYHKRGAQLRAGANATIIWCLWRWSSFSF